MADAARRRANAVVHVEPFDAFGLDLAALWAR
jgi:hypothetical protein